MTKTCSRCQKEKALTDFSVARKRADGLQTYCKTCNAEIYRGNGANARPALVTQKLCRKCGETKPSAHFYTHVSSPDGLQTMCKSCKTLVQRGKAPDRVCSSCQLRKPTTDFYKTQLECKACQHPEIIQVTPDAVRWDRYCDGTYARADVLADLDAIDACLYRIDGYHAKAPEDHTYLAPLVPLLSLISKTVNTAGLILDGEAIPTDEDNDDEEDDVDNACFQADSDAVTPDTI